MRMLVILAVAFVCGCDRIVVNHGRYGETTICQEAQWYAPAIAYKTENGVMVCCWSDSYFHYKSNTVTGVIIKRKRSE